MSPARDDNALVAQIPEALGDLHIAPGDSALLARASDIEAVVTASDWTFVVDVNGVSEGMIGRVVNGLEQKQYLTGNYLGGVCLDRPA